MIQVDGVRDQCIKMIDGDFIELYLNMDMKKQ
jgi:hypothetical protein